MKAGDFRLHCDGLFKIRLGERVGFIVVEIRVGFSEAEVRRARAGVQRNRSLELLDGIFVSRHSIEYHTELMVRTKMLRRKLNLPAVRHLSLFELPGVEQDSRQALPSREHRGVQGQRPLAALDRQVLLARMQI